MKKNLLLLGMVLLLPFQPLFPADTFSNATLQAPSCFKADGTVMNVDSVNIDTMVSDSQAGNENSSKKVCILAAGQSNIDGRNPFAELPSYVVNPNPAIRFSWNKINGVFSDFAITDGGHGRDWAFDAIVYNALVDANHGAQDTIYVIKRSYSGSSIDPEGATDYHWTTDYEQLPSERYSLLRLFERGIRAAIERDGDKFDIKAIIWHQGCGDANVSLEVAERYQNNLRDVVAYMRNIVGKPELPFICGTISENNHVCRWRDIVNQAIWNLTAEDDNFYCIDMSGATLLDAYHFDSASSEYFGQKVYDLLVDLGVASGGVKYNPVCPWDENGVSAAKQSGHVVPGAIYTLLGTQVSRNAASAQRQKGVYIIDGKKVVVK